MDRANQCSATIDTIGSTLDTVLAVYTGSSVGSLTTIASDDDSGGNGASRVVFTATSGTTYRIAVDGFSGAMGNVTLNWIQPAAPMFVLQPRNRDVVAGTNVTFTATAIGTPDPGYQWRYNGVNLSGATSSSFTTNNVQTNSTGDFTVVATNTAGSVTSAVAHLQVYHSATPLLSEASFTNNYFRMVVSGVTGAQYIVEASTNLVNWTKITTNITTFTNFEYDVTNYPYRFYRGLYDHP